MSSNLSTNDGGVTPPVLYQFSEAQLRGRAEEFMRMEFGIPRDLPQDEKDRWHQRYGLLLCYVNHLTSTWCSGVKS